MSNSDIALPAPTDAEGDARIYLADRLLEPLRWIFRWGSLAMLVAMVSLPFIQVVAREIFSSPIIGAEELARFMLISSVFLAFPYVVTSGANIRMEEILSMFPAKLIRVFKVLGCLTAVATFAVLAAASAVAILANLNNSTPTLGIPYWIFLGAAFASFSMTTIECAVQVLKVVQNRPLYITFAQEQEPQEELDLPEDMRH